MASSDAASAERLVDAARALIARRRRRAAFSALLAAVAAVVLGLATLDALLALGGGARIALAAGAGVAAAVTLLAIVVGGEWTRLDRARAARLVEDATADRERRLTAALQLAAMPGDLARAAAERLATDLPAAPPRDLPTWRARPFLIALGVTALVVVALQLALPRLLALEWQRYRDPFGDHPPFSLTELAWAAGPEHARPGSPARFEVEVAGRAPADVVLRQRTDDGVERAVPMYRVGERRWAGDIEVGEHALKLWAEGGGARTAYRRLETDPVPVMAQVDLRLEAPAYARLEPERARVKPGGQAALSALPGSRLVLAPTSNRPLAAVRLRHGDDAPARLPLDPGAAAVADPTPGAYALALEAVDGSVSGFAPILALSARVDQPPRAAVVQPAHDAIATPGMAIPFLAECDDDLGLARIEKVREHDGLGAPTLVQKLDGTRHEWRGTIDLRDLGVAPGDVLVYGVVAVDGKPGGGQASEFAHRAVRIVSEDDYNRMLRRRLAPTALQAKYGDLLKRLVQLEKDAAELKRQAPDLGKRRVANALGELARQADELAAAARALKRDKPLFEIEPELQQAIADAADEVGEAARSGDPNALPGGSVGDMLTSDLAQMAALAKAEGMLARLRQLIDAEQQTTLRLEPLAEHRRLLDSDRVRLRELGEQEDELAAAIDAWLALAPKQEQALREASGGADDAPLSGAAGDLEKIEHDVAATGAAELKRKAATAARGGDGAEAHRLAAEARDQLLALLQKADAAGERMEGRLGLSLSWADRGAFGASLDSLSLAAARGFGLGGSGNAGFGFALGYGGDDFGGSDPSMAMDLYGPEALGQGAGQTGDGNGGIAAMAAAGEGTNRAAPAHHAAVRASTAAQRSTLAADEERLIGDYFKNLEEAP